MLSFSSSRLLLADLLERIRGVIFADKNSQLRFEMLLTADIILQKVKGQPKSLASLKYLESLNLWGMSISDISCLPSTTPNLRILSLVVNEISDISCLVDLPLLTEVYLRENRISDWEIVWDSLSPLTELTSLYLAGNPIASDESYRSMAISMFPRLQTLDGIEITEEDRLDAAKRHPSFSLLSGGLLSSEDDMVYLTVSESEELDFDVKLTRGQEESGGSSIEDECDTMFSCGGLVQHSSASSSDSEAVVPAYPVKPVVRVVKKERAVKNERSVEQLVVKNERAAMNKRFADQEQRVPVNVIRPAASSHNILVASLSLIREMDNISLNVLKGEIETLLLLSKL
jgi:hypothetical protein